MYNRYYKVSDNLLAKINTGINGIPIFGGQTEFDFDIIFVGIPIWFNLLWNYIIFTDRGILFIHRTMWGGIKSQVLVEYETISNIEYKISWLSLFNIYLTNGNSLSPMVKKGFVKNFEANLKTLQNHAPHIGINLPDVGEDHSSDHETPGISSDIDIPADSNPSFQAELKIINPPARENYGRDVPDKGIKKCHKCNKIYLSSFKTCPFCSSGRGGQNSYNHDQMNIFSGEEIIIYIPSSNQTYILNNFNKSFLKLGRKRHNDIIINDDSVSGIHCYLFKKSNSWYIEDQNSTNGTILRGSRITTQSKLVKGDYYKLGDIKIVIK